MVVQKKLSNVTRSTPPNVLEQTTYQIQNRWENSMFLRRKLHTATMPKNQTDAILAVAKKPCKNDHQMVWHRCCTCESQPPTALAIFGSPQKCEGGYCNNLWIQTVWYYTDRLCCHLQPAARKWQQRARLMVGKTFTWQMQNHEAKTKCVFRSVLIAHHIMP